MHSPLADVDWRAFERAWERYDDIRFRPQVERVLGPDAFTEWKGFTQALLSGAAPIGGFDAYADRMVEQRFLAAEGGDPEERAARRAFTAVYVYFAILAGWELSDRYDALRAMVNALVRHVPEGTLDLTATDPPPVLETQAAYGGPGEGGRA